VSVVYVCFYMCAMSMTCGLLLSGRIGRLGDCPCRTIETLSERVDRRHLGRAMPLMVVLY